MNQEFICTDIEQLKIKQREFLARTKYSKDDFKWQTQLDEINTGLADTRVSVDAICLYAKPQYTSKVMYQIRLGATQKLTIDELKFVLKFSSQDTSMMSKVRVLLSQKDVDLNFIKSLLIEDNKDIGSKYLNTSSFANGMKIATPLDMLEMAKKYILNGYYNELNDYVSRHSIKENREFLALCSKLELPQAIDCLEMELPLNAIYSFVYIKEGQATWSELIEFLKMHDKAKNYAKAFCKGIFYKKYKKDIKKLFKLDTNKVIDRLFVEHDVDVDLLGEFTGYRDDIDDTNSQYVYSGYAIRSADESKEICEHIVKLFSVGKTIDCIKKFISPDCKFTKLSLDIYLQYPCSPEQAIDAANILGAEIGPDFTVPKVDKMYQFGSDDTIFQPQKLPC